MADDDVSARTWYEDAWAAGWAPLFCTRNQTGSWVPQRGTTGSAPWPRVQPVPPPGLRYRRAVRVPDGVVLLDVDCDRPEQPDKDGWATLTALAARWGPLPPSVRLTARGPFQHSGRYAYRVPPGTVLRDPGVGVEVIRSGHRFSWAPGDVHPATRTAVAWLDADGGTVAGWPDLAALPALPAAWVSGLSTAASTAVDRGPGRVIEHGQALAAEDAAWAEFCAHSPGDGGLRSALLSWARLAAGRQLAAGVDAAALPALIWKAMTGHPAWPSPDWEPEPTREAITYAVEHADDDAPVVLPKGTSRFEADGYPKRDLPKSNDQVSAVIQPLPTSGRMVTSRSAASITPRRLRWLWRDELDSYVVASALTLFAGRGDVGKSTTAWWVAAQLSQGKLPGECFGTPSDVHIYATEDEYADTIVPRLIGAGAAMDRIHVLFASDGEDDELPIDWQSDLPAIRDDMRKHGSVALIVDPIISTLPVGANANHETDIRPALTSLKRMLAEIGAAGIGIAHFNKNTDGDLDNAVSGAAAWRNIPRSVIAFVRDKNANQLLFGPIKSNGSRTRTVRTYELASVSVGTVDGPDDVPVFTPGNASEDATLAGAARSTDSATATVVAASEEFAAVAAFIGREGRPAVELANATAAGDFDGYERWDTLRKKLPKVHFTNHRLGFQQPFVWTLTRAGIAAYAIPVPELDGGWAPVTEVP